jgi:biotin carboxylase
MRVLIINRHSLEWTTGPGGDYVPAEPSDRFLITRTFGSGLAGHSGRSFPNVSVLNMNDMERVEHVARWIVRTNDVDFVVALHEKDMLMAARLRQELGLPGMQYEPTLRFRDKALMKETLLAAGYERLPRFRKLARGEQVTSVPWRGRTVVKSRWGVGSSQVRIARDIDEVNRAREELERNGDELGIEEFIEGAMYHCDSVVCDGDILFSAPSQYIARPGDYAPGRVAGSVLISDRQLRARLGRENSEVLRILGMESGVTHAEFFRRPSGEFVFCEVAARPGGGGIDDIVAAGYGVELIRAAVELQCGVRPDLSHALDEPRTVAGVIGIYHSSDGRDHDAGSVRAASGVRSYAFSPQEFPGVVRHCTDYAHKIVAEAPSHHAFTAVVERVVRLISTGAESAQRRSPKVRVRAAN